MDGALDVAVADVAEDAAQQQHVGGQRVREAGRQTRIRLPDLDLGQPLSRRRPASQAGIARIGLDQDGAHIIAARMMRQDPRDVMPLPGTQADQADPARRCAVNRV